MLFSSFPPSCYHSRCEPYVCGLNLFQRNGIDAGRFQELKEKIAGLQSQGAFVKLAVGGQQFGNTIPNYKVNIVIIGLTPILVL